MKIYKVRMHRSAVQDLNEIFEFLITIGSNERANRYINAMMKEVLSLSIFADLYPCSRYAEIRRYHAHARHLISHNKRWIYVFHIEDDKVIVDRIRPSKLIKK